MGPYASAHVEDGKRNVVDYRHVLPVGRVFGWDEIRHFKKTQYLLMMPFTVIDLAVQTLCDVLLAELSAGAEVLRHACVSP